MSMLLVTQGKINFCTDQFLSPSLPNCLLPISVAMICSITLSITELAFVVGLPDGAEMTKNPKAANFHSFNEKSTYPFIMTDPDVNKD